MDISLSRVAPGLAALLDYKLADAPADVTAGLAVAAVAVPVGIAYAGLAGFPPEVGLYSTILPLVAYAIFGSSRQLIVGPDAATCAVVAAAVAPLAAGDAAAYASISVTLALLTGLMCIAASFLRLGVLADFLSKPILVGSSTAWRCPSFSVRPTRFSAFPWSRAASCPGWPRSFPSLAKRTGPRSPSPSALSSSWHWLPEW